MAHEKLTKLGLTVSKADDGVTHVFFQSAAAGEDERQNVRGSGKTKPKKTDELKPKTDGQGGSYSG